MIPASADDEQEEYDSERELSLGLVLWNSVIHTVLSTIYFLLISCIAIAIDLSLHWFERLAFVEKYGLSRMIRWEIELMAYALATVDCFLFLRKILQPFAAFIRRLPTR